MNTIFPTTEPASNTPSATVGPSVHVLAGSVAGIGTKGIKNTHIVIIKVCTVKVNITISTHPVRPHRMFEWNH